MVQILVSKNILNTSIHFNFLLSLVRPMFRFADYTNPDYPTIQEISLWKSLNYSLKWTAHEPHFSRPYAAICNFSCMCICMVRHPLSILTVHIFAASGVYKIVSSVQQATAILVARSSHKIKFKSSLTTWNFI